MPEAKMPAANVLPGEPGPEKIVQTEVAHATVNGLSLAYETFGNPADPAVLLIMGLGAQLIQWPLPFCQQLADRGHYVIRYDHRDIGLSSRLDELGLPNITWTLLRQRLGLRPAIPYRLQDLAGDALGLLDHLHIRQAHLVGASMGGMIAQLIAIQAPSRALSLTSMMSTTGSRRLPRATRAAQAALAAPLTNRQSLSLAERVEQSVAGWRAIGSPGFPVAEALLKARCEAILRRGYHPQGVARHLLACLCAPDRSRQLRQLTLPTLIIHGTADPLLPLACGAATAECIPHAEFYPVEGMGHDLPDAVLPQLVDRISALTLGATTDHNAIRPDAQPRTGQPKNQ